jgi:dihydroorotase (multifunctional complex type)
VNVDLAIVSGTIVSSAGRIPGDVLVRDGMIAAVTAPGVWTGDALHTVDATGKLVLPGMIDVHVHTREPGYTHKEDITTCTQAAAAGGVTTIFGMPNLDPPTVTRSHLDDVLDLYAEKSLVDYNHNPVPAAGETEAMAAAGIAAFKVYMVVDTGRAYPHPAGTGIHDHGHLLQMFEDVAATGRVLMVHPHDQAIMDRVEQEYWKRGDRSPKAYAKTLAAYDGLIWDTATATLIRLAEATGCRLHIVHAQTTRSIEMIRAAKERGLPVTAEVNHWALFLGRWEDVTELGPYCLSYWVPDHHREAIWEGIADGTIDMLSSDHAPHTREEKDVGWKDMWAAHTGTPGIQCQLPLLLDAAAGGTLSLDRVVELTAEAPARSFDLATKGRIAAGFDADIVIVDPDETWKITNEDVLSKIGWTPYDGRTVHGRVTHTFVRGEVVYADGEVQGKPGHGTQARPAERMGGAFR